MNRCKATVKKQIGKQEHRCTRHTITPNAEYCLTHLIGNANKRRRLENEMTNNA